MHVHHGARTMAIGLLLAGLLASCSSGVSSSAPSSTAGTVAVKGDAASPESSANLETSSHDNKMTFDDSKSSQSLSFTYTMWSASYSITHGQPWNGLSTCAADSSTTCQITVNAGRKKSATPANFFNDGVSATDCAGVGKCPTTPDELNFSFYGTLTIKAKDGTQGSYPISLGQGSWAGSMNNWWIGGRGDGWTSLDDGSIMTPDGNFAILGDTTSDSSFHVSDVTVVSPSPTSS